MSVKHDRGYARTAQDLERKYSFGKTFGEMLGLINDNRDKVDSVESELRSEIVAQATTLKRDTEQIVATATQTLKTELSEEIEGVSDSVAELTKDVEMKISADDVSIVVREEIANGVDRVETSTGYTFDYDGLTISQEGEEMENKIDNTGMYVTRYGDEILTANNEGVGAVNLHAKTYLIVGADEGRSRFEDYGIDRTGCFWIGG